MIDAIWVWSSVFDEDWFVKRLQDPLQEAARARVLWIRQALRRRPLLDEHAAVAGVFTQNRFCAAPVLLLSAGGVWARAKPVQPRARASTR